MLKKILLYSFLLKLHFLNGQEYPFSNYKKVFHTKEVFEKKLFLQSGHYVNLKYIIDLDPVVLQDYLRGYYVNKVYIKYLDPFLLRDIDSDMHIYQEHMQALQNQVAVINNTIQRQNAVVRQ